MVLSDSAGKHDVRAVQPRSIYSGDDSYAFCKAGPLDRFKHSVLLYYYSPAYQSGIRLCSLSSIPAAKSYQDS